MPYDRRQLPSSTTSSNNTTLVQFLWSTSFAHRSALLVLGYIGRGVSYGDLASAHGVKTALSIGQNLKQFEVVLIRRGRSCTILCSSIWFRIRIRRFRLAPRAGATISALPPYCSNEFGSLPTFDFSTPHQCQPRLLPSRTQTCSITKPGEVNKTNSNSHTMADKDYDDYDSDIDEGGKTQRRSQAGRKLMRWNRKSFDSA